VSSGGEVDGLTLTHGEGAVGEGLGERGLVRGEDEGAGASSGDGPGAEVGEELNEVGSAGDVEVGEGFVEEQKVGVGEQDACE